MKATESTRRLRILHIVGGMGRGGLETWLMHVLRHIDRGRFEMDFMVHTADACAYDEEIRALGGRVLPCLQCSRPWIYAKHFRRLLAEFGPYDIVHSHVAHFSGYTLRLAQRAGVPVRIAHSHNDTKLSDRSPNPFRRIYLVTTKRWIRCHATLGLAVSAKAAEALFGPAWQSGSLCRLLSYGIDLDPFRAGRNPSLRATLPLPTDAFVIGHVGRFVDQKNHRFLLEVTRAVVDANPNTCLLLIGDGPLRRAIERRAAELSLTKHVVFAGLRSDVPRLLLGMVDVFVMPSLYEGLGLVCIEAQAAGLPCVIADTVPGEADAVPRLVTRLSVSESASTWAEAVLAKRGEAPPVTQGEALAILEASPFNIRKATGELARVYENAVASAPGHAWDSLRLAGAEGSKRELTGPLCDARKPYDQTS